MATGAERCSAAVMVAGGEATRHGVVQMCRGCRPTRGSDPPYKAKVAWFPKRPSWLRGDATIGTGSSGAGRCERPQSRLRSPLDGISPHIS
jgi:hypothetical protein